jgi:hypothetical protein
MPLPKDARISPDKSLILGEGDNWAAVLNCHQAWSPSRLALSLRGNTQNIIGSLFHRLKPS